MSGFYYSEAQKQDQPLKYYVRSRELLLQILQNSDSLQGVVYQDKIEQLNNAIRYAYQYAGGSLSDSLEEILAKQKQSTEHQ